jgi:hypothetical protein
MAPPANADFASGDAQRDPVARLVAFDFYDGALAGFLETHSGRGYRFDFIDDWPTRGERESVRMFLLRPLSGGAFSRLVELISPHCQVHLPYWVPSWWHLPHDEKQHLDGEVDAILDSAGPPEWAVAGHFLCGEVLLVRPASRIDRTPQEWAATFGLPAGGE